MMLRPDVWNRSVKLTVIIVVLFTFILWFKPPQREDGRRLKTWFSQSTGDHPSSGLHYEHAEDTLPGPPVNCPDAPDAHDIVITVKTGASEAASRIPTQLETSLRCPPNILHFSDMEQKVGNVTIHDALSNIPEFLRIANSDFDLYRQQQARKKAGWYDEAPSEETKKAAWTLDKYKNLHIVSKSYWLMPQKKWYLHIDADTYLVWSSLVWWLDRIQGKVDPVKGLYAGSLTCFGDVKAAHGGSGILLSEMASRAIVLDNSSTIPSWDAQARGHCCGDELVAQALRDNDIEMHNAWPLINGDSPGEIPFGPAYWCEPIVTMHHLSVKEMEMVAAFEDGRQNRTEPLTYVEFFNGFVFDLIPETTKDNWDNDANGITTPNIESFEKCIAECQDNNGCFTASYDGTDCILGTRDFKLGLPREPEDKRMWQSYWDKQRIKTWAAKHTDCSNLSLAFKDAFTCG